MYKKQNLHTHCTFCDGKNTPEEMILEALSKGFDSLGFSSHSYHPYLKTTRINAENEAAYLKEITLLKETYKGQIDIFLGIEYEICSEHTPEGLDYKIGAAHYINTCDGFVTFDVGAEGTQKYVDKYFGGDGLAFSKAYYETVATIPEKGDFDILAHFDLITKNNDSLKFIDTTSPLYKKYATEAIDALAGKIPFFEVNTGAIARGYRTSPYPSLDLLKEFKRRGFGAVITSDCHDKNYLDCHFDEARELLLLAGFKSKFVLTQNGFEEISL
ncbi:MAG: histidinol-phosphatase [Clostridia bacterium]|nr:histidinol-phosphatase [Clostridia bacterium]